MKDLVEFYAQLASKVIFRARTYDCIAPRAEPTTYRLTFERATNWAIPVPPEDHITPGPQGGGGCLLPTGGIVGKEQPRHEKAIPMGPNERSLQGNSKNGWIVEIPTFLNCCHELVFN